tara:strand:- start:5177 stop:5437 length:261 start_codon:yes stop_codon:yes gene_type:complete
MFPNYFSFFSHSTKRNKRATASHFCLFFLLSYKVVRISSYGYPKESLYDKQGKPHPFVACQIAHVGLLTEAFIKVVWDTPKLEKEY